MKIYEFSEMDLQNLFAGIPDGRDGLLIFDGDCVICNSLIKWLLKHDNEKVLAFTTFNSLFIEKCRLNKEFKEKMAQSLLYLTKEKVFAESTAVTEIALITVKFPVLVRITKLVPLRIKDAIYRFIARYRYQVFGKTDKCIIPPPGDVDRFLL